MTRLSKKIERKTSATVFDRGKRREVIVTFEPPDLLGFRLKGTRRTYYLTPDGCYSVAVERALRNERHPKRRHRTSNG
jgi:hypothetical protein